MRNFIQNTISVYSVNYTVCIIFVNFLINLMNGFILLMCSITITETIIENSFFDLNLKISLLIKLIFLFFLCLYKSTPVSFKDGFLI